MASQLTISLTILLFLPVLGGLLGAVLPKWASPMVAVVATLVPLGYAVLMLIDFEPSGGLQYITDDAWIGELGIRYSLGVNGLNLWLVALTTLIFAAAQIWLHMRPSEDRPGLFGFHLGLAETAVLGAFLAQDLALFVLFFDLMLVPFYFLLGQWGGEGRVAATMKMVIYTLVGSLLMLAAAVALAVLVSQQTGEELNFSIQYLAQHPLDETTQRWLFVAFALAFLIKMPSFPFHGWMPDAYGKMPLVALTGFSGVLSKVAAYGFLRIVLPIFPDASVDFQDVMLVLGVLSILYGSVMAFTTTDIRLILGYSSVAQLGFISMGIFSLTERGAQGAITQMVNHGLVVAPLFFILAVVAERAEGSTDIRRMGGIAMRAPVLATLFLIAALANLAIPGSANFVGEFLILFGLFEDHLVYALLAAIGVALAAVYTLRAFIGAMHNRPAAGVESRDLTVNDGLVIAPLVAAIIAFGVFPQAALSDSESATTAAVQRPKAVIAGAATPETAASETPVDPAAAGQTP